MGWVVNVTSRPLYPRDRAGTHCTGGYVDPRAGLDWCGKISPPPAFDPQTVQSVASHYTNWAIPASPFTIYLRFYFVAFFVKHLRFFFKLLHTLLHHILHPQILLHTSPYLHYSQPPERYCFLVQHFFQILRNPPPQFFFRVKTSIEILKLLDVGSKFHRNVATHLPKCTVSYLRNLGERERER